MSLPVPFADGAGSLSPRQVARARRAQTNTELAIYQHGLQAHAEAEMDRLDSQAIADVSRTAMEEELALLDYGLHCAGQSPAKIEIVARTVERLSTLNNRRISRRFGG
jgi:hypothetical protein